LKFKSVPSLHWYRILQLQPRNDLGKILSVAGILDAYVFINTVLKKLLQYQLPWIPLYAKCKYSPSYLRI